MIKKSDLVRNLVAEQKYKEALRIAKDFHLGISKEQSDRMKLGYECITNPRFYRSIGFDIDMTIKKGIETVISLYGI